jgi:type IX secretion system PorP/SprF family membrane protein
MKRIVLLLLVLQGAFILAQNRVNFSQYMHNHQIFNPAYMDGTKHVGGSMLYRMQWMGFEGSPRTMIGNGFYNVKNHSFNLQLLNDNITVFKHMEAGLSYSYSINLDRYTKMSLGVKATFNQQTANYGSLNYFDAGDQALSGGFSKIGVNFGAGLFVRSRDWYAGIGAPYIFNNKNIDPTMSLFNDINYNHFYFSGGYKVIDNDMCVFYPTALLKWTKGAPLAASMDLNFIWNERLWGGLGYRIDNTVVFSAGIIFLEDFKAVYSYDLGLGKVNRFGGMTHEISIGYGMELYRSSFTKRKFTTRKMGFRKRPRRGRFN